MNRMLVLLPVVAVVGCGYGFNPGRSASAASRSIEPLLSAPAIVMKPDARPDQQAIGAALDALQSRSRELYGPLKADAQPSAFRQLAGDMAKFLKDHDLGAAPSEFKSAWNRHQKGWKTLQAATARLPDAYEQSDFTDALQGLFKEDPNRGKSLGGDMVDAVKAITKSHTEMFNLAETSGLEIVR